MEDIGDFFEGPAKEEVIAAANELVKSMQQAAKAWDEAKLRQILDKQPGVIDTRDRDTCLTALHVAVRAGQEKSVAFLLSRGASVLVCDKEGHTPLDYARLFKKAEVAQRLKEHVMSHPPERKKLGPLISSFFEGSIDRSYMEWALSHYGVALLDCKGREMCTPLHFAVTTNDAQLVKRLLDMGADPFVRDVKNQSPLDYAKMSGNREMTSALVGVMKQHLYAIVGVAVMIIVFRNHPDPDLPWYLVGVVYPTIRSAHAIKCAATVGAGAADVYGEWLTYWCFAGVMFMAEKAFGYIPHQGLRAVFGPPKDDGSPSSRLKEAVTLYFIAKILLTMYLVYPASRGSRYVYSKLRDALVAADAKRRTAVPPGEKQKAAGDKNKSE